LDGFASGVLRAGGDSDKKPARQSPTAAANSSRSTGRKSGIGLSSPPTPNWPRDYRVCGRKPWRRKADASSQLTYRDLMRRCAYCGDRIGFWSRVCSDCKKLMTRVEELRGKVGYGEFLDGLERTGVAKEKIVVFLKADPDGNGSVQDQVTAEMAMELMKVMGISGQQTPQEVKRIRDSVTKDSK